MGGESAGARVFLFTDIESSTRLWERFPEHMRSDLARHDEILGDAVRAAGGVVVKSTGDGLMAVFDLATSALAAARDGQRALAAAPWAVEGGLRVRMGIHDGPAQQRGDDYFGPTLNRTARIMAAGHGGQVLVSGAALAVADGQLPDGTRARDLGEHRLKDLAGPEHLFQLVVDGLPESFPPLATLDVVVNNLPAQPTPFLGRQAQLRQLAGRLDQPGTRLITLVGPGGTGKTRLALQAAAEQVDRFRDGVFVVDLSTDRDPHSALTHVVRSLSAGLSVAADLHEDPLPALRNGLAGRALLLVLDNCEQVPRLGAAVAELLAACPLLVVLATSREPLHIRGEHVHPIPPLDLPVQRATTEEAFASEAVRLFVERAAEVDPGFALDDDNVADVVAICRRLDGLPLALELAAARTRLFSPGELRSRLRLGLLRGGAQDLPDRQQALEATIAWSYTLLTDGERALVRLLGVFDGADVAAVEQVARRSRLVEPGDVVDGMDSLLAKSLLRTVSHGGRSRVTMLQTIREYATARLAESGDADGAVRAHAQHFADWLLGFPGRLAGPARAEALDLLEADLGNALASWRWFVGAGDTVRLTSMLGPLWTLHYTRGWYTGLVQLAGDLLGILAGQPQTPALVRQEMDLRTSVARALMSLNGYTAEVEALFTQALDIAASDDTGDVASRIPVLRSLAGLHTMRAQSAESLRLGEQLLALAADQPDVMMLMDAHLVVGFSRLFLNDTEEGLRHLDTAIGLFQPTRSSAPGLSVGAHPGVVALTTSAIMLWFRGFAEQAEARAARADEASAQVGQPLTRAYALFHTAYVDLHLHEVDRMGRRADELLQVATANDYPIWRALAQLLQGLRQVTAGEHDSGLARMDRAMALYVSTPTPPVFWAPVQRLRATGLTLAGRPSAALALCDEALSLLPEESFLTAQTYAQRGDIHRALHRDDPEPARLDYQHALEGSHQLGLTTIELIAATRLVQLAADGAARSLAVDRLRTVFDRFTEGFANPDVRAAAAELDSA